MQSSWLIRSGHVSQAQMVPFDKLRNRATHRIRQRYLRLTKVLRQPRNHLLYHLETIGHGRGADLHIAPPMARNSAASRQVVTPPMPGIGGSRGSSWRAISPPYSAPWASPPGRSGRKGRHSCPCRRSSGEKLSRSTLVIDFTVLIRLTASAPPPWAAQRYISYPSAAPGPARRDCGI